MIVDAIDAQGRRYMQAVSQHFTEDCLECGRTIPVGEHFFMRNDATDGTQGDPLFAALAALTYDAVCKACGERQLGKDSN